MNGQPLTSPFFMSPFYPYFLAFFYRISPSPIALLVGQAILDTITVIIIYKIGSRFINPWIGFTAALRLLLLVFGVLALFQT